MKRTRKNTAGRYLMLVIAGTILVAAMTPATRSVPAVRGSAPPPVSPNPSKGRHNGKIVFISDRNYKGLSIWTINPDGSSPTRLTDDKSRTDKLPDFSPVYDSSPVWSPDGTKIAFISNRDYLLSLYVMNADGSNARLVADKPLEPAQPAWSPDGGKIAFTAGMRFTFGTGKPSVDIYVINVDGSGLTQLTRDSGANGSPSWSPDGKQIAFVSDRDDGKARIWIMNADGSNPRILPNSQNTGSTGFHGSQPAWSPDGTKILFTAYRICGGQAAVSIYVTNVDGTSSQLLTNDPNNCGWYSSPRWSPDGTKILAGLSIKTTGSNLEPAPQIVVMNADGSNQINISNRGKYIFNSLLATYSDGQADWQPLPAPASFASSVIGFSAPSYTGYDDAGPVPIMVKRTGNLSEAASCFYITMTPDMRVQHPDREATGTFRFAPGESLKTFSVRAPVSGTSLSWSYKVVLSDNEGNATFVGGIKEADVEILPSKASSPKKNPQ
jgi:Tol biopolymer transport system component